MREQIKIAAKMYSCQESAKKLFRNEYSEKIKWYMGILNGVMEKERLTELKAVLFVSNFNSVKENGIAIMMFMAAAVELIEGNKIGMKSN